MIDILSMPSSLLCAWKSLSRLDCIREYYSLKSEVHGWIASALLFSMLGVSSKLAWGFLSTLYCWKTGRLSLWYLCIASRNLHFLLTWRPSAGLNLELMDPWTDRSKDFGCLNFRRLEHCFFFSSPFACLTALPRTHIPLTNTHTPSSTSSMKFPVLVLFCATQLSFVLAAGHGRVLYRRQNSAPSSSSLMRPSSIVTPSAPSLPASFATPPVATNAPPLLSMQSAVTLAVSTTYEQGATPPVSGAPGLPTPYELNLVHLYMCVCGDCIL